MTAAPRTVADHLMDRLAELGADRVFGVPGDYTLSLLDHVVAHPGLTWTGCSNELNAGYAADGYARLCGIAALCTTFGVGELSAINALAGSYAEHVPVVQIVGSPATRTQAAHRIVHHSLGDGVFDQFLHMHTDITVARASLTAENAAAEIDRVLVAVRDHKLPGYLLLPADVAEAACPAPTGPLPAPVDPTDPVALAAFREAAAALLAGADGPPVVLGGLLTHRFGATAELARLVRRSAGLATTMWAKSLLDEADPRFTGIYAGAASDPQVRRLVEDAPVLITAGVQFTDLTSGFFSQQLPRERTVEVAAAAVSVGDRLFQPIALPTALRVLADLAQDRPVTDGGAADVTVDTPAVRDRNGSTALTQQQLWDTVAAHLRPGDVVLADQGTSFYGMATHRLPTGVTFLGQPLWASIGWTVPALLGACLGAPGRRGVLLVGDGAAQMTVQELATVLRLELPVLVVVVDNDGYTVERAIHGPAEPYNDIARYDWAALPAALGLGHDADAAVVRTETELTAALGAAAAHPARFSLVQAVVDRLDVPPLLTTIAQQAARANARSS
ncbi:alpha-keto acid decarboxylase family protein [Nakamurella leprariae]|uniref:Alpha-keto-acid decarboxylase n=1 Tax=Nakamurella leprariae TaxID=2803911 RepID=A0A939C057_9ACTN|nr:thiamine pyrophosphate-binding protein [Nakamurella leprariae]MBM9468416.1 alpha-keto acid decarboxylase family protein [Nakamurella leprariae]